MQRKGAPPWLLCVVLASIPHLTGASDPLVLEGLDPTIFGSILDRSTRRIVNSGEEFRAYLSDVTVSTLLLNDSVILSSEFWTSTVLIEQRAVQISSAGSGPVAIDLGGLVDAIHVAGTGVLGLRSVVTRNGGPRSLVRLDTTARYRVDYFGAWPSITLDPGAQVVTQNCTLYTYSERPWQQCTLFQNYTASFLQRTAYGGRYSSIGKSQVRISDRWAFKANVTDLASQKIVGVVSFNDIGLSVICQPDPFMGLSIINSSGDAVPAQADNGTRMPWWGGLLCGMAALVAAVFAALLGYYVYNRHASRRACAQADVEKVLMQQQAAGQTGGSKPGLHAASPLSPSDPRRPSLDHKLDYSKSVPSEYDGNESSFDEGVPTVETPAPSSHNTSITEAVMSLPDLLRARSAQLVGALELGAPLGRGSFGKVYKGKWKGTTVAVKIIEHSAESSSGIKELRESVLSSSIIHPNVVSTYKIRTIPSACPKSCQAYREEPKEIDAYQSDPTKEKSGRKSAIYGPEMLETWLLLEFCDRGTLDRAIMQKQVLYAGGGEPNLEFVYRCLIDIAAGMDYLHSLGVINGDLKPANVLLKSTNEDVRGFTCKLADFGLSRVLDTDRTHVSTQTYGTLAYQPAELLQEGKLTKAADVHSFSMIMYEMYSKQRLFDGCKTGQAFYKILMGFRPTLPPDMPSGYRSVMTSCWSTDPAARPGFDLIIKCLQKQLIEHLQDREGMKHQATIDRPFSDEHVVSPAERDAENAAFLSRVKAATQEAHSGPEQGRRSLSRADILPIPEGQEAGLQADHDETGCNGWLGTEEMGEDLGGRASSLVGMHRIPSGTSSFDEQLWEELDAQARRRRSTEGSFDRGRESRGTPTSATPPLVRPPAAQGALALFGPPSQPALPMSHRPSAGFEGPAARAVPESMASSPFAVLADSGRFLVAQQAFLAQAANGYTEEGQGSLPSRVQQETCEALPVREQKANGVAAPIMQPPRKTLCNTSEMALGTPENKDRPYTHHQGSLGAGSGSAAKGQMETPSDKLQQKEPMGIDELAVLNKRAKRRPVQPHRLAEMMAALDSKDSSCHSSFTSAAASRQDAGSRAPDSNAQFAGFPKAVSEGWEGSHVPMSTLMGVSAVSQSVPELLQQPSRTGATMSKSQAQIANDHIVSQVLRKKMGRDARASKAPRVSSLLQKGAGSAAAAHAPTPSPGKSPRAQRPNGRTVTFAAAHGADDLVDRGSQGRVESTGGGCTPALLPLQLLQQGVESMGGALEVSPSAFGGFTVREDFVTTMRLNISHASSMPAEGASRSELEMIGRSGGPSAGNRSPASANMHQCRQSAARTLDNNFAQLPDISTRVRSMPSRELVRIYSSKAAAHGLSLGSFPVDRKTFMAPVNPSHDKSVANGVHGISDTSSQELQENPFASPSA